ncbi:MAG: hypothetical protein SGARI_000858 [Bacillariaceae sp.]
MGKDRTRASAKSGQGRKTAAKTKAKGASNQRMEETGTGVLQIPTLDAMLANVEHETVTMDSIFESALAESEESEASQQPTPASRRGGTPAGSKTVAGGRLYLNESLSSEEDSRNTSHEISLEEDANHHFGQHFPAATQRRARLSKRSTANIVTDDEPLVYTASDLATRVADARGKLQKKFDTRVKGMKTENIGLQRKCAEAQQGRQDAEDCIDNLRFIMTEKFDALGIAEDQLAGLDPENLLKMLVNKLEGRNHAGGVAKAGGAPGSVLDLKATFFCPVDGCIFHTSRGDERERLRAIRQHWKDKHLWQRYPKGAEYTKVVTQIFDSVVDNPEDHEKYAVPFMGEGATIIVPVALLGLKETDPTKYESQRKSFHKRIESKSIENIKGTSDQAKRQDMKLHHILRTRAVDPKWEEVIMLQLLINFFDDKFNGEKHQRLENREITVGNGRIAYQTIHRKFFPDDNKSLSDDDDEWQWEE